MKHLINVGLLRTLLKTKRNAIIYLPFGKPDYQIEFTSDGKRVWYPVEAKAVVALCVAGKIKPVKSNMVDPLVFPVYGRK